MEDRYAALRLKNQLCFPLYAVSNMITRKYKPLLDKLDLTYTQYIVMMVLWEEKQVNEKFLCEALCLKSNTLAPLLQKLESKGYIKKEKDGTDERNIVISLTPSGKKLQNKALCVPESMAKEFDLTTEEAASLYRILYKMLDQERNKKNHKEEYKHDSL
ncbi:MAG: MarR family transcriptional regulator [Clostridia bacterium]|nr:MarR family transcriptional regulator [Clostridia bacterium]